MRYAARPFQDDLSPDPPATWWDIYDENRDLPMAPQTFGWTCSICATDWLLRATGLDPYSSREKVALELGWDCVDPYSGLKDTQCLVRLLEQFGVSAQQEWVSWDRALELAGSTAYILNSTSWYHFTGGRGVTDWGGLWIANSASGYRGIYDTVDESQWNSLPGWQMVWIVR
jgi:hypothetical protein